MRKLSVVAVALLSLALVAATPRKKDLDLPSMGETIEVSIINLDVFVTDKQGNRVHGLTKDDFEILEDGKPQPLSNFAEYTGGVAASRVAVESDEGPTVTPPRTPKRTFILFVDRFFLPGFKSDQVFDAMKKFVQQSVRPGDAATVVEWSYHRLWTKQDFTDDQELLARAIDSVRKDTRDILPDMLRGVRNDTAHAEAWDELVAQDIARHGGVRLIGEGAGVMAAKDEARMFARMALLDQKAKTSAIKSMLSSISGVEGKKVMLLASHRLSQFAGAEYFAADAGQVPAEYRSELDARYLIDEIIDNANANGVTIYPMYPEGLSSYALPSAEDAVSSTGAIDYALLNNETPVLADIAKATGGLFDWSPKSVAELFPRVEHDLSDYYSLGYRATTTGEDRGRKITVRAKNPEYAVRSRREYVEKSDETRMKDRVIAALFRETPADESAFRLTATLGKEKPKGKDRALIPLTVHIPVSALTTLPKDDRYAGAFSIYLATGHTLGQPSDVTAQTQSFKIPAADLEKAKADSFAYDFDLLVDPFVDRISVGVFDEVGRQYSLLRVPLSRK